MLIEVTIDDPNDLTRFRADRLDVRRPQKIGGDNNTKIFK